MIRISLTNGRSWLALGLVFVRVGLGIYARRALRWLIFTGPLILAMDAVYVGGYNHLGIGWMALIFLALWFAIDWHEEPR